tara:strand:- start:712 stop:1401 length:690 start_codon:yes stop_codon:yes gene_type:complete
MAYQDWLNRASTTNAVSNNMPPALIPSGNSVLNEQPVPSSYTSNRVQGNPGNTAVSSQGQINSIMGLASGGINTPMFPGMGSSYSSGSGNSGNAPSSWSGYSSGGSTGATNPSTGTGNPGVTQTYSGQTENTSVPYSADPTYSTPYFGGSTTTDLSWGAPTQEDYGNTFNEMMNNYSMIFPGGSAGGYEGTQGLGYTSFPDSQAATDFENISNVAGWITNPIGSWLNRD